jgi:CheY-like chemotaxis protein
MKKILVVDDQKEVRSLILATLRNGDFHFLQACSGQEAIEVARSERPDLIVMDLMMPGVVDGLEATKAIRDDPATKHAIIFMLTAKGQHMDKLKGIDAGADAYIVKPFRPSDLNSLVSEYLV